MNAPTTIARPWNYNSVVTACDECGGEGWVRSLRRPTVDDPYPETTCSACDGPQAPECTVCGCTTVVPGYDCIVCQTVGELPEALLTDKEADATILDMVRAITRAIHVANHALETRKAGGS